MKRWGFRPVRAGSSVLLVDVVLAVVASVAVVLLVAFPPHVVGTRHDGPLGSVPFLRCLLAVAMTAPVAWRRLRPAAVAAGLLVAAAANALLVGHVVRCGPALPVLLVVAFTAGRTRRRAEAAAGWLLCAGAAVVQCFSDPDLDRSTAPFLAVLLGVAAGAGWLVTAREATAAELRRSNRELRRQREQTAALAVSNEREQVSAGLDAALRTRLQTMAELAQQPAEPGPALAAIQQLGREALGEMREVVGSLHTAEQPAAPQPVLGQLQTLLREASADTRLVIEPLGTEVPPGVELSAYRIVEHLVTALESRPDERLDVRISLQDRAVQIDLAAPAVDAVSLGRAVAAIRQRAALHGGTVELGVAGGVTAVVRLPVTA